MPTHRDECETCRAQEPLGVLHIYGQRSYHRDAHIVGDVLALTKLRDALNEALEKGRAETPMTPHDGEGYMVHVIRHDTERMSRMMLPYREGPWHEDSVWAGRYPESLVPCRDDDEIMDDDEWFEAQRNLGTDYEKNRKR